MSKHRRFVASLAVVALMMGMAGNADAYPLRGSSALTIRNDRGGQVISYAIRMLKLKQSGRSVRFTGGCDSACTLFLALPRSKTCISSGASFGFHLPYGASGRGNATAAKYLMSSYPGWVQSWVRSQGGLSGRVKTMTYAYASQYLPTCNKSVREIKFVLPQLRSR